MFCVLTGANTDADSYKTEPGVDWKTATISLVVLLASFIVVAVIVAAVYVHNKRSTRLLLQESSKPAALSTNAVPKRGRERPCDHEETCVLVSGTTNDLAEEEAEKKETYQRKHGRSQVEVVAALEQFRMLERMKKIGIPVPGTGTFY
ncbi:hypothetical protein V1264_005862 [Littorina saxatilis]|uniref:Uncharacterized protein n=1 Tax=Littorina saxatilis TaxID=31220 RepID=A0AAN9B036_9CAEN